MEGCGSDLQLAHDLFAFRRPTAIGLSPVSRHESAGANLTNAFNTDIIFLYDNTLECLVLRVGCVVRLFNTLFYDNEDNLWTSE